MGRHSPKSSFWSQWVQIFQKELRKYESCICWSFVQKHWPCISHRQLAVNVPQVSNFAPWLMATVRYRATLSVSLLLKNHIKDTACTKAYFGWHDGFYPWPKIKQLSQCIVTVPLSISAEEILQKHWWYETNRFPHYKLQEPIMCSLFFNFSGRITHFNRFFYVPVSQLSHFIHSITFSAKLKAFCGKQ